MESSWPHHRNDRSSTLEATASTIGCYEKPTKNTKLPIQVIISKINQTYSGLNIKANSAEWTLALNLQIFFTYNTTTHAILSIAAHMKPPADLILMKASRLLPTLSPTSSLMY